MQKNLSNKRGSISLFVLLSALFFLVVVTAVAVSFRNKEAGVDAQIAKIKQSYEKDVGNEEQIYNEKKFIKKGIKVGDYITYTSPTASVTFTDADTGYSDYATTPETLTAKNTFRVMEINNDGSMVLMGAMTSSDTAIHFSGAVGYNNAVYTLNKKCSDLYKDESKGITARSIKVEDITSRFSSTGTNAISSYINTEVGNLSTGSYTTEIDTTNKKVTYVRSRGYYPDIFQYEAGGVLDGTPTTGVITGSQEYSGYNGLTAQTYSQVTNTNTGTLTAPYTYYNITPSESYFDDNDGNASAYQNMFFGTKTLYWIASRCVVCNPNTASFRLRIVYQSALTADGLFGSNSSSNSYHYRMCPIVYLPSSVQVTVSTDESTYHQTVPHVVQ